MPKKPTNRKGGRRAATSVPKIPSRIVERSKGGDPWIKGVNDSIKQFNEFSSIIPNEYGWRFKTKKAFDIELRQTASAKASPSTLNRFYWLDMLKNLEAYTVMSVWRTSELLRNTVRCLTDGEKIVSAIVVRAAVESVAQFLDVSRKVSATLADLQKYNFRDQVIANTELEELILKSVFSSRLPDAEKELSPTNIITILQRVSKIRGQEDLMTRYGVLCEVTHPNFLGRSVYVSKVEIKQRAGDELRTLSQEHGPVSEALIDLILWAVSWSAATQESSAVLMQSSIRPIVEKIRSPVH